MASSASASIRAIQPREALKPTPVVAPVIPTAGLPSIPQAPTLPVANPDTASQESFIRAQLDPAAATFIGHKTTAENRGATGDLRESLAGYGGFTFKEGDFGVSTVETNVGTGDSLGEEYRHGTLSALFQQNAKGMQNSRLADEAVGIAWSRLNSQKRDFFSRYATTVSGTLNRLSAEMTGLHTNLLDLYGKDVQYALDNPIIAPAAAKTAPKGASRAPGAPIKPKKKKVVNRGWGRHTTPGQPPPVSHRR